MVEKMGGSQNDKEGNKGKGGLRMAAMAAGVLAAGAASAQNAPANHEGYIADSYDDYSSSYEDFSASPDALAAVDTLNEQFGQKLSVTPEKYELIAATLNAYVAAHPAFEGKTITTKEGVSVGPSYNPLFDLQTAITQRADEMNPLLLGLIMQNLSQRMKLTPAEKSK